MDAFVTARVPEEIKLQGNKALQAISATPTQLVNDAYRYVIAYERLPMQTAEGNAGKSTRRTLTASQTEDIREILEDMRVVALPSDKPFDELLAKARDERYAAFA